MKILLLLVTLLGARAGWGQKTATYQELTKLVSPPGAVPVGDSLWLDEAEITIIHWVEYLHFLQKDSSAAFYRSQQPDEAAIREYMRPDWSGEDFTLYNLRSPSATFHYLPMVGITYAQARNYCRWRTAVVNQKLHTEEYLRNHSKLKKYEFRVEYRLPTVREWELAAAGGLDPVAHPLGIIHPAVPGSPQARHLLLREETDIKNCLLETNLTPATAGPLYRMEFTLREQAYFGTTGQPISCRHSYHYGMAIRQEYAYTNYPNAYGLYNMIGNVAELTATPGLAKGGSFQQSITEVSVQKKFPYTQPQPWLGFRCACTVCISPKP